ncbi:resolvase [Pseudanabaena phage Pan2]|nr:resolvase [Pseudanabaena phage Pan2]
MTWPGLYLGIDPGKRTGVAWIHVYGTEITPVGHSEIYDGDSGFIGWWDGPRWPGTPDTIIFEGFTTREGKFGIDHTPERVIGALKALATRDGVDLIERPPAGRKRQVPDGVLRRLGMYLPGEPNRNAREAVRHIVAYLKSQKHPTVLEAFNANRT